MWLSVFFIYSVANTASKMYQDYLLDSPQYQYRATYRQTVKILSFIILECFHLAWLIYGNKLYYSSVNKCGEESSLLSFLMLAVLIIGYFHLMAYLTIILVVCTVVYMRFRRQGQKLRNSKHVLKNLKKIKFSAIEKSARDNGSNITEEDSTCIICYVAYNSTDDVVKLKCNDKHYYHTECIESWIKSGKNSCPMCRQAIDNTVPI